MYECHITIEPVFDQKLDHAKTIANSHGFRVAELLMKKREHDSPERSSYDTFMTGYSNNFQRMVLKMQNCIYDLQDHGFTIWRYKIEDIIVDSKVNDEFNFLEG